MLRSLIGTVLALALSFPAAADMPSFPASFRTQDIAANGATLHVRIGGQGPAVVLLHGMGDTGDMWAPLAGVLARDHTVVIPDLRGMGLSSHPEGGYDKKNQPADVRGVLKTLGIDRAVVVGHDIGIMVAFAYAARYPQSTDKLVIMDAPLPSNEALVTYADVGKARELLGYDPHVTIDEGLERFWAWYQAEVLGKKYFD